MTVIRHYLRTNPVTKSYYKSYPVESDFLYVNVSIFIILRILIK